MDTVLVVSNVLKGKLANDTLFVNVINASYNKEASSTGFFSGGLSISIVICLTILLLVIAILYFLWKKQKFEADTKKPEEGEPPKKEDEQYDKTQEEENEKARYRDLLVKFLERRALGEVEDGKPKYNYDETYSVKYTNELKHLIDKMQPTEEEKIPEKEKRYS